MANSPTYSIIRGNEFTPLWRGSVCDKPTPQHPTPLRIHRRGFCYIVKVPSPLRDRAAFKVIIHKALCNDFAGRVGLGCAKVMLSSRPIGHGFVPQLTSNASTSPFSPEFERLNRVPSPPIRGRRWPTGRMRGHSGTAACEKIPLTLPSPPDHLRRCCVVHLVAATQTIWGRGDNLTPSGRPKSRTNKFSPKPTLLRRPVPLCFPPTHKSFNR